MISSLILHRSLRGLSVELFEEIIWPLPLLARLGNMMLSNLKKNSIWEWIVSLFKRQNIMGMHAL